MAGAKAQNCKLFYSTDNGTTYTQITGVTSISKPESSRAEIDMTDLDSTAKEYDLDIPDNGTVSFSLNFDGTNATHQAMLAYESSGDSADYKIELKEPGVSTVTTISFDAFVSSLAISAQQGGKQEGTLNLRVTGASTIAHGATAES